MSRKKKFFHQFPSVTIIRAYFIYLLGFWSCFYKKLQHNQESYWKLINFHFNLASIISGNKTFSKIVETNCPPWQIIRHHKKMWFTRRLYTRPAPIRVFTKMYSHYHTSSQKKKWSIFSILGSTLFSFSFRFPNSHLHLLSADPAPGRGLPHLVSTIFFYRCDRMTRTSVLSASVYWGRARLILRRCIY